MTPTSTAAPQYSAARPCAVYEGVRNTAAYRDDLHILVEAADGTLAASTIMWFDEANRTAEFEPVGTHRDFRRWGLAQAMLLHGMHVVRAGGASYATVVCLSLPGNAALQLYESLGFRELSRMLSSSSASDPTRQPAGA